MLAALAAAASMACISSAVRADTLTYQQDYYSNGEGVTLAAINEGTPADSLGNTFTGYTAYAIVATTVSINYPGDFGPGWYDPGNGSYTPVTAALDDNGGYIGAMTAGGEASGGSSSYGLYSNKGFLAQSYIVTKSTTSVSRSSGPYYTPTDSFEFTPVGDGEASATQNVEGPLGKAHGNATSPGNNGADGQYASGAYSSGLVGSGGSHFILPSDQSQAGTATENTNAYPGDTAPFTSNLGTLSNSYKNSFVLSGSVTTTTTITFGTDSTLLDSWDVSAADAPQTATIAYVVVPTGAQVTFNGAFGVAQSTGTASNVAFDFKFGGPSGPAAPEFPFSIDDYNTTATTAPDPDAATIDSAYVDAASASEIAPDDKNISGDEANVNARGGPYAATAYADLAGSTGGAQDKVYLNYAGLTNGDTIDVLLKFTSSGGDPLTGPDGSTVLADLLAYITGNNDGGDQADDGDNNFTATALVGASSDIFPIADKDLSGSSASDGVWDILLQDTDVQGDPMMNLDFSQFSDSYVPAGSLDIAQIAVVPEPASLGLMAIGAAGLLLRGRKKKA